MPALLRPAAVALALLALVARPAGAQARWREIGRTGNDNPVEVDARSVAKAGGITTATLRVRFLKPPKSPKGPITSSRTVVMFDCAARKVAVKENTYYLDERANRVYQHNVVGQPGWGPAIGGSMTAVALDHFCPR